MTNALHILLWSPQDWFRHPHSNSTLPDDVTTLSWWLVELAAVTHCYRHTGLEFTRHGDTTSMMPLVSNELRRGFLSRVTTSDVREALNFLKNCR